ncbi:MAG: VOC family protein [Acetobacteraceae bacterium]
MTPPLPLLDHAVIGLGTALDAGEVAFRRLGFALTPRGHHTLGSMNRLAVFGTDYIELLAAPADSPRREVVDGPRGLAALVFATRDADGAFAALEAAGVPAMPPQRFSRPVTLDGATRDAVFRTVRLPADMVPAGRFYFCEHATPELVWHDAWRRHPNRVTGIAEAVIAAADPAGLAGLFARMFGAEMLRAEADGFVLALGLARCHVVGAAAARARFGAVAAGRSDFMAALVLRSASLEQTRAALAAGGVAMAALPGGGILVAAEDACGVALGFVE